MSDRLGLTPDNAYYDLPDLRGKRVLEIGANNGYLAREIILHRGPRDYLGVDHWQGPDATIELRHHWRYGDISRRETLPFGEHWEIVICFDVLYHLTAPLDALLNLAFVTRECLVLGTTILPEGESRSPSYPEIAPHVVKGPVMRFEPNYGGDATNYFYPTESCLTAMLEWAGFKKRERRYYYQESVTGYFHDRVCYHCWK